MCSLVRSFALSYSVALSLTPSLARLPALEAGRVVGAR